MELSSLLSRGAVAVCITLSACAAAGPGGAADAGPGQNPYGAFLAARYADGQGNPAVATRYYAQALQADPGNQQFATEGFIAALLAGSPDAAAFAARAPDNTLSVLLAGNQAAIAGRFAAAKRAFSALPPDGLNLLLKPLLLAWAELGQGHAQAALNTLGPGFSDPVFGAVYVLNAALIADAAGDKKDAAQLYAAVDNGSPNLRLAEVLASWKAREGNKTQAEAVLVGLAEAHPDLAIALPALEANIGKPVVNTARDGMAEAYMTLAGSLNDPSQAFIRTIFLRFALMLRPDLTAARLLLANDQIGGGNPAATPGDVQLQNALDTLMPVSQSDALYAPVALQEAVLLSSLNRPAEAVAILDRLIAIAPKNPVLLANAGDVLRNAGQNAAAIPYYTKAIATIGNPPPSGAWTLFFDRGISEDALGNWAAAEPDMNEALTLSPSQPYVLNYIGYSWALRGEKLNQAKAMLEKAVSLDPNDGAVLDSLGYVDMRRGDTAKSVALLTQAVELDPDDAEVNGHLGDAFWAAGEKLQAAYQWQRALSLKPDAKLRAEITAKVQQHFAS